MVGGQIIELLRMADMAKERHLWPVAGGLGDQTIRCREAFEAVWAEVARHEAEQAREMQDKLDRMNRS